MKKFLCVLISFLLLVPFGTIALSCGAVAEDAFMVEDSSNTAVADNSVENASGATISGNVGVAISLNNGGEVVLKQRTTDAVVKTAQIAADGSYLLEQIAPGIYNMVISVPGWTDYNILSIDVSENEDIIFEKSITFAGDADHDGEVDLNDVRTVLLKDNFGKTVDAENVACDIDHDGSISISDLSIILSADSYTMDAQSDYYRSIGWSGDY